MGGFEVKTRGGCIKRRRKHYGDTKEVERGTEDVGRGRKKT